MKKIISIITIVSGILFSTVSCEKFLDVNDNPNDPVNVPLEQRLPNALTKSYLVLDASATSTGTTWSLNALGNVWMGYWSKSVDGASVNSMFRLEESYAIDAMGLDRDGRPFWEDIYGILMNYKDIESKAIESGAIAYAGIAQIMQGYHFMQLVDLYNNVPFDDALQGSKVSTPKYEPGEQVYNKSMQLINQGIEKIKTASSTSQKPTNDDVIFKGDLLKWLKFANTIKLRALLRQSEINKSAYIQEEIAKINQEGSGFLLEGENAAVAPGFTNTTNGMNPFWETYYKNAAGSLTAAYNTLRPTEYIIEKLLSLNDPRIDLLYKKVNNEFKGVPLGQSVGNEYSRNNTSPLLGPGENNNQPGALIKSISQGGVLLSSAESFFIQAEASERAWISGSSQDLYERGIKESFKYMEVNPSLANDYISQNEVNLSSSTNRIERILEQKWLALNTIGGFEAWNDFRRLGYPTDIPQSLQSPNPDPNYRPLRLGYRQSEYSTNPAQVKAQGNINPFVDKVFWDK